MDARGKSKDETAGRLIERAGGSMMRAVVLGLVLLLAQTARAWPADPPECLSLADCVAIAQRDPATFMPTLRAMLSRFEWLQLQSELDYTHPRPAVSAIVRELLVEHIRENGGHSFESAWLHLRVVLATEAWPWRRGLLFRLLSDAAGPPVVAEWLEATPSSKARTEVMLVYMRSTRDDLPDEAQPQIERYDSELFNAYVALPESETELRSDLVEYIGARPELFARLIAYEQGRVRAGLVPGEPAMKTMLQAAEEVPRIADTVLGWAESSRGVRQMLVETLFHGFYSRSFPPEEQPRLRRILLAHLKEAGKSARWPPIYVLWDTLSNIRPEEAPLLWQVGEEAFDISHRASVGIQYHVADTHPNYRPRVIQTLRAGSLERAREFVAFVGSPPSWIVDFADGWLRALTDQALRAESVQERFRTLSPLLEIPWAQHLEFPPERWFYDWAGRSPPVGECGTGRAEARQAREEQTRALEAFGLLTPDVPVVMAPQPYSPPVRKLRPLAAGEGQQRWTQFVAARRQALAAIALRKEQRGR